MEKNKNYLENKLVQNIMNRIKILKKRQNKIEEEIEYFELVMNDQIDLIRQRKERKL